MPDVVIDRVNLLGKDQPEALVFTDRKGRPIGDVQLTGVEGAFKSNKLIGDQTLEEQVTEDELAIPTDDEESLKMIRFCLRMIKFCRLKQSRYQT